MGILGFIVFSTCILYCFSVPNKVLAKQVVVHVVFSYSSTSEMDSDFPANMFRTFFTLEDLTNVKADDYF